MKKIYLAAAVMALALGMTACSSKTEETAAQTLSCCDGVIVGSWLKEHHDARGEVNEAYVRAFVRAAKG